MNAGLWICKKIYIHPLPQKGITTNFDKVFGKFSLLSVPSCPNPLMNGSRAERLIYKFTIIQPPTKYEGINKKHTVKSVGDLVPFRSQTLLIVLILLLTLYCDIFSHSSSTYMSDKFQLDVFIAPEVRPTSIQTNRWRVQYKQNME